MSVLLPFSSSGQGREDLDVIIQGGASSSPTFSHNNKWLTCGSQIWSLSTGLIHRRAIQDSLSVHLSEFRHDDKVILGKVTKRVKGKTYTTLVEVDPETGSVVNELYTGAFGHYKYNAAGDRVIMRSYTGEVSVLNCKSKTIEFSINYKDLNKDFSASMFELRGNLLYVILEESSVYIDVEKAYLYCWDISTETLTKSFEFGRAGNAAYTLNPDGSRLYYQHEPNVSMQWGKKVNEVDVLTGKQLSSKPIPYVVKRFLFKHESLRMIVGRYTPRAYQSELYLYDFTNDTLIHKFEKSEHDPPHASIDKSETFMVSTDEALRLWDIETGYLIYDIENSSIGYCGSLKFSPDGRYLAFGSIESLVMNKEERRYEEVNTLKLWDLHYPFEIKSFPGLNCCISDIEFSADSKYILLGGNEGEIALWNLENEELEFVNEKELALDVRAIRFAKDNTVRAVQSSFSSTGIFNIETGDLIEKIDGYVHHTENVDLNKDGSILMFCEWDKTIFWDVDANKHYKKHNSRHHYQRTDFHPDGNLFAGADLVGKMKIFDIQTNKTYLKERKEIKTVKFNPHSPNIFGCSTEDGELLIYKQNKRKKYVLHKQWESGEVHSISFHPENRLIATTNGRSIKIWDFEKKELIVNLIMSQNNEFIFTCPDKYYYTTKGVNSFISFSEGSKSYYFDQFDLYFNRPDTILARLDFPSKSFTGMYAKACDKRLEDYGAKSLDNTLSTSKKVHIEILEDKSLILSESPTYDLNLKAHSSSGKLSILHVSVNKVPEFGLSGFSLESLDSEKLDYTHRVILSEGNNRIEVSVIDEIGNFSTKEVVNVHYAGPVTSKLNIITLGVSDYDDPQMALKYPATDAEDICKAFENSLDEVNGISLTNEALNRDSFDTLKDTFKGCSVNDGVILFVSGHGTIENGEYYFATTTTNAGNVIETGISFSQIMKILGACPARNKLLILNSCYSGQIDNSSSYEEFKQNELMRQLFTDIRQTDGVTILSASAGTSVSKELFGTRKKNGKVAEAILKALNEKKSMNAFDLCEYIITYASRPSAFVNKKSNLPSFRQSNRSNNFKVW